MVIRDLVAMEPVAWNINFDQPVQPTRYVTRPFRQDCRSKNNVLREYFKINDNSEQINLIILSKFFWE